MTIKQEKHNNNNKTGATKQGHPYRNNHRSRSEQAPGSVFHPRDENTKIDCGFLGPFWCNKKFDPER